MTARILILLLMALPVLAACADPAPAGIGAAWPAADALFARDARFLGADGAYTVDLGGDRVLWLFGDTLVARDHAHPHENSAFLRNSVALQTGRDPVTAFMRHYWQHGPGDDDLGSFFPEPAAGVWLWPAHGARVGDVVVLFFERLVNEGDPGPWSFVATGWDARVVENPDDEPSAWRVRPATLPDDGGAGAVLGEAVALDGAGHLVAFGTRGDAHAVVLARFAVADAARGDLSHPELRCGARWAEGCAPSELFSPGAPEFSVSFDAGLGLWVWVASGGFGAAPLVWRTAPALEGPWSDPVVVFRPPEATRDGAFVYAGKAHPELDPGPGGGLVVTWVPSGLDDLPASLDGVYYRPRFGRVWAR
ncbi:MAG: DUF4185 domain-containing protein [Myxococcales bacterium]|nr:DUF4185 domain-containing protein [Myxococcales bacterium]MCB9734820.1 DUF4185 domain-containing protein [Deltaproteobacteria bacterium]